MKNGPEAVKHREDSLWPGARGSSAVLVRCRGRSRLRLLTGRVRPADCQPHRGGSGHRGLSLLPAFGAGGPTGSLEGLRNEMAGLGG